MKKVVLNIIKVRKSLIRLGKSGKPAAICIAKIEKMENWIKAYSNRLTEEQWRKFAQRNLEDLRYLCPSNKSGDTLFQNLLNNI